MSSFSKIFITPKCTNESAPSRGLSQKLCSQQIIIQNKNVYNVIKRDASESRIGKKTFEPTQGAQEPVLYRRMERMTSEPWNVNFKMKPTLLWCKILREISWSHCIGDQKHHLSQSVFQPSSLYIAFFSQLYNFNSKKAVAFFSSLKEILSKMKSDQGAVFCIRGTDVAALLPILRKRLTIWFTEPQNEIKFDKSAQIYHRICEKASGLEPAPQIPRTLNSIDIFQ